jgi:UDP-GlcNAc:undecaprenyl-phosphate GlcNAc-1-phosphate transferase
VYLVVSIAIPREIPFDAGVIAGGLSIAVLGSLVFQRAMPWIVRAALYVGSTCLMYYGEVYPRSAVTDLLTPVNVGMAVLAVLVLLTIRFAGEDRFQTTPLDYLIVLLAGAMPFLPEMTVGTVPVGLLAAKLIVLFFAFELLLHMRTTAVTRLGLVSLVSLGGVMLRAWWP